MTRAVQIAELGDENVFKIDDDNNRVGIGSTQPTVKLDVGGDVSIADKIIHTGDTNTAIRFPAADIFTIETGGTEAFRVASDQKVYFGDFASAGSKAYIEKEVSGEYKLNFHASSSTSQNRAITFNSREDVEALRIKTDGTLAAIKSGTHITNAEQTVAVFQRSLASGSTSKISIVSGNAASSHINFGDTDDEDVGQIVYDHSSNSMQFLTNTSEKLRIDSSGRLLVGTTSDVSGGLSTTLIQCVATGGGYVGLARNDTSVADGNGIGGLRFYANDPSGYNDVGIVQCVADGAHATNDYPTRLEFHTTADGASSPTERLRIDSSGRLLVGATSAATSGSVAQYAKFVLRGDTSGSTSAGIINLARGAGAASMSSGFSAGVITFSDNAGLEFGDIGFNADGTPSGSSTPGRFQVKTTSSGATTPTERLRITSGGDLLSLNTDNGIVSRSTLSAGTSNTVFIGQNSASSITSGTNAIKIYTNGNIQNSNNSYGSLSDVTLKENIVDANSQWADIKGIRVRNYNFKEDTGYETFTQLGVVAQELEEVSPGLVNTDKEGIKSVNYSVLYMKAFKALQEAITKIETLETQNSSLEARLTALEG